MFINSNNMEIMTYKEGNEFIEELFDCMRNILER